jgi:predicted DNA-binding transcriptional regulator AlpA
MNLETLAETYISVPEIALDLAIPLPNAHVLVRSHRFPKGESLFGRPVFLRSEYEQFKADNAEYISELQGKHTAKVAA